MLRRKVTKSECERIHVKRRFLERFGINLTRQKRLSIISMILQNRATFIKKESNRVSLFDVDFENQVIRVAYDRLRKELVTALVPTAIALDEEDEPSVVPNPVCKPDPFWDEYKKKMLSDKAVSSCKTVLKNNPVSSQIQNSPDPFWDEYTKKMLSGKTVLET